MPAIGRPFTAEEDKAGAPRVLVMSDRLWTDRFGRDERIVGRTVTLDGQPFTVIGVMPKGFDFPRVMIGQPVDVWLPFRFDEAKAERGGHFLGVVGRLRDGVLLAGAQAQMDTIAHRLQQQYPDTNTNWLVNLFSLHDEVVGNVRTALMVLVGAVGFVLLIACANVANLLLARATGRAKELAVRAALGAGQGRLVRQLLTESVVLSFAGALLGVILAAWGLDLAASMASAWLPRSWEVGVNLPVLVFTAGAAIFTGIVFGLAPSIHVTRAALAHTLKTTGRGTVSSGHQRLRTVFVVAEVALAFVLLIGAGLLVRSFHQLAQVRPGFQPDQTMTAVVSLPDARYDTIQKQEGFTTPLLERVRRVPGVRAAALASFIPFDGKETLLTFEIAGEATPPPANRRLAQWRVVSDGFFETLGIPVLKGRAFTTADTSASPKVAVIGRALAKKYFGSKDPIGQRVTLDEQASPTATWFTVVGIVDDVRYRRLSDAPRPQMYFPVSQQAFPEFTLVAKTGSDPFSIVATVRGIVRGLDAAIPLNDVRTLEQVVSSSMAGERFRTTLLVAFAVIALVLSTIGVYGVMSYSVEQRAPEMGLRMALGASPGDVLRLVAGQGLRLAVAGVVIGLVGAFWVTRLLASLLFGVSATDPATFGAIATLLIGVAALASYLPARRATRTDPMVVLRVD
jgi:putative ABC transport system permease protein